ncbi:sulfite exporter TauE/SafE family protein [candidate division WWE3 bacterium]|nr:sulfite exporter TauE/SafE family protein [candidate division WWE3 bacterium]
MIFTQLLHIFDGNIVNLWIAFAAGLLTFFASCLLPLVPSYLAYISGLSYTEIEESSGKRRRDIIFNSIIFTIGFVLIFVILGVIGNKAYSQLIFYKKQIEIFVGILFVLLGLYNLGFFSYIDSSTKFKFLKRLRLENIFIIFDKGFHFDVRKFLTKWNSINSFIIGLGFGLAWTPCIGPVLGVILFWASEAETLLKGVYLLIAFGVGMGFPFVLVGAGAEFLLEKFGKNTWTQKLIGIAVLVAGIMTLIK